MQRRGQARQLPEQPRTRPARVRARPPAWDSPQRLVRQRLLGHSQLRLSRTAVHGQLPMLRQARQASRQRSLRRSTARRAAGRAALQSRLPRTARAAPAAEPLLQRWRQLRRAVRARWAIQGPARQRQRRDENRRRDRGRRSGSSCTCSSAASMTVRCEHYIAWRELPVHADICAAGRMTFNCLRSASMMGMRPCREFADGVCVYA